VVSIDQTTEFSIDAAYAAIDEHLQSVARLRARIELTLSERDQAAAAAAAAASPPRAEELSPAELRTLRLLVNTPMSAGDIAKHLYVSVNTTKTHMKAIYRKLGVQRRSELPDALRARGWRR
jgi:LuxR family maltose regulon positive regulatory protein